MRTDDEIVIRIKPSEQKLLVEQAENGVILHKEIAVDALLALIKNSAVISRISSGLLPANCLAVGFSEQSRNLLLWYPPHYADISYHDTVYEHFPLPRLVFGFRLSREGKPNNCHLGVIADEKPWPETPMYHYPFPHVNESGGVCLGFNSLPVYKETRQTESLLHYVLGLPNADDWFEPSRNKGKLQLRELLELLKDKTPQYYYEHILVPNGENLQSFMKRWEG